MGEPATTAHAELDAREDELVARLARISGRTPQDIRNEARRRAMRIEMESMRRGQ